jgi:hypothetical protein
MFTVHSPSDRDVEYIFNQCAKADPFLLRELRDQCSPRHAVSIDARKRMPGSYYWFIEVEAPPCFFGDFRELWEIVQDTKEVPVSGLPSPEFAKVLQLSLEEGGIPEGTTMAGYVYLLSGPREKNGRR